MANLIWALGKGKVSLFYCHIYLSVDKITSFFFPHRIYLCEHRNSGGSRRVVVTLQGQTK